MKFFRDAVHGRIPVSKEYCKYIIDTLQFQRLKRIEQTSMRDLYPSAHHDRFVHSIGTYHIGRLMGEQIKKNIFDFNDVLNSAIILNADKKKDVIDSIIKNFEVACLLHDCGHAPFSHTFEECFKQVNEYETDMVSAVIKYITMQVCIVNKSFYQPNEIERVLNQYFILNKDAFDKEVRLYLLNVKTTKEEIGILKDVQGNISNDDEIESLEDSIKQKRKEISDLNEKIYSNYENAIKKELPKLSRNKKAQQLFLVLLEYFIDSSSQSPKPHERISSWLVLHEEGFGKVLREKMHLDPLLMARMICGYKYNEFDKLTYCDDNENNSNRRIKEILNCFISLLNGEVIDADKLDYCLRDKWASGMNVNNIELNKLLQGLSIRIHKGVNKAVICFSKGAIPEIESMMDSKSKVTYWCHNHNKIVYRQELLKNAVEKLAVVFASKEQREEYQHLKRCRHELVVGSHTDMPVYDENWHFVGSSKGKRSLNEYYINEEDPEKYDSINDFIKIRRGIIEQSNIGKIFNYHSFIKPQLVTVCFNQSEFIERLFLISDDDIMCLLKKFLLPFNNSENHDEKIELEKEFTYDASKYVKDLFSRNQDLIPLWKSRTEFLSDFKELILTNEDGNVTAAFLERKIEKTLNVVIDLIKKDDGKKLNDINMPCRVISKKMTVAGVSGNEIFINTGGNNIYCYTELDLLSKTTPGTVNFVYAFVPKLSTNNGEEELDWSESRKKYREILNDIK